MRDRSKIVILLLIVAIVFSGVSIYISLNALSLDIPVRTSDSNVLSGDANSGGISLGVGEAVGVNEG
ncbi:hypothetical protein COU62_02110 [Candidatus Pacearchaeota archaeon CG10_big_fil_rev_8_21_14_0_10_35_219]|nr:hypothetical protein [Candidatus Pacearchaeota archaeon]PIO07886.1 MAG: hypothetical protein COU62_02110 [Candidatus Pacearchaeota archaeon CG10_big_fil_rev_8_21_14_0_10_35_219]PIY81393.1 MAG: hypothetical protein COY79_02915 [Candidatus Pacearchaeota archaeon CG_4_10_14_0_8_um_filter_35_169]PIZ79666.1 MAG: hypothetical protein COY00_03650 [Candidatus Pacearchaeota archaeon CG_4_10_14_0_2_um_filter_35_33]PJA70020.1 MAG: hypothetical protein CO155_02225 [Candidatus Pacearchaeota archaeon CG_4